ncbi:hypothetical protein BS78_05G154500 [Paspalum vaginatum]|nr:hypothetical protein BS78_05G154500 [Paspalum vaginatum]
MDGKASPAILAACVELCIICIYSGFTVAGAGECSLSSIVVTQAATGGVGARAAGVGGDGAQHLQLRPVRPEAGLRVCDGFDSTLAVDPAKLTPVGGGVCLVNGGSPVAQGSDMTFSYARGKQFGFQPVSSMLTC